MTELTGLGETYHKIHELFNLEDFDNDITDLIDKLGNVHLKNFSRYILGFRVKHRSNLSQCQKYRISLGWETENIQGQSKKF